MHRRNKNCIDGGCKLTFEEDFVRRIIRCDILKMGHRKVSCKDLQ